MELINFYSRRSRRRVWASFSQNNKFFSVLFQFVLNLNKN